MVRLGGFGGSIDGSYTYDFNYSMVRLGVTENIDFNNKDGHFNSSMVRLGVSTYKDEWH